MPHGKPAGMPCVNLDDALRCRVFGDPSRPAFCASLQPQLSMCGATREEAMMILDALEMATRPDQPSRRWPVRYSSFSFT